MGNKRVVNTGQIGNVQDAASDDDGTGFDFNADFLAGLTGGGGGVTNTGVTGNVQNASGNGNTQSITYRRR